MRFVLVSSDPKVVQAAREGFHPEDELLVFTDWKEALDRAEGTSLLFVDLLATLTEPYRIGGYEVFAEAKMSHPTASRVPLVLIREPDDYELDYMTGYPDFLFGSVPRPVNAKVFRRFSTYV